MSLSCNKLLTQCDAPKCCLHWAKLFWFVSKWNTKPYTCSILMQLCRFLWGFTFKAYRQPARTSRKYDKNVQPLQIHTYLCCYNTTDVKMITYLLKLHFVPTTVKMIRQPKSHMEVISQCYSLSFICILISFHKASLVLLGSVAVGMQWKWLTR